ncbi:MAG: LamG-like jellyroll fold domain-containing protein [Opitutales bacterium]
MKEYLKTTIRPAIRRILNRLVQAAALTAACMMASALTADDGLSKVYRWLGAGVGPAEWNDPDNWHPEGVPDHDDIALFTEDGQDAPAVGGEIRVGTIVFDDSLSEGMQISAEAIYIDMGIEVGWNHDAVVHHELHAASAVYFVEYVSELSPGEAPDTLDYYAYTESTTIDGTYAGSTLDLYVGGDAVDLAAEEADWMQETHYWDFEFGLQDAVGDAVPHGVDEGVERVELSGWGTVLATNGGGIRVDDPRLENGFNRLSFSIWFNLNSIAGTQVLYEEGSKLKGMALRIDEGFLEVGIATGTEGNIYALKSTEMLNVGQWYMATVVYDGSNAALDVYLNAAPLAMVRSGPRSSVPASVPWHGNHAGIGQAYGTYVFGSVPPSGVDGYLDNFTLYENRVLDAVDVVALYADALPEERNRWSFSGNLEDGAPATAVVPAYDLRVYDGSENYDSSDYIDGPSSFVFDGGTRLHIQKQAVIETHGDHSLSLWFKTDDFSGFPKMLYDAGGAANGYALRLAGNILEAIVLVHYEPVELAVGPVTPGQWHLATFVYEADTRTASLLLDDGSVRTQADCSSQISTLRTGSSAWCLGGSLAGDPFQASTWQHLTGTYTGLIDRVAAYDRALDEDEIRSEYLQFNSPALSHAWTWESGFNDVIGGLPGRIGMNDGNAMDYSLADGVLELRSGFVDVNAAGSGLVERSDALTLNLWFHVEDTNGILPLYRQGGMLQGIALRLNNGFLEAGFAGYEGYADDAGAFYLQQELKSPTPVELNDWVMATLVFDGVGDTLQLYQNGALVAATETAVDMIVLSDMGWDSVGFAENNGPHGDVFSGVSVPATYSQFSGYLADLSVWNNVSLDEHRIRGLYDEAYWTHRFSFEGSADDSVGGLSGKLLGSQTDDAVDYDPFRAVDGESAVRLAGSSASSYLDGNHGVGVDPGAIDFYGDQDTRFYSLSMWVRPVQDASDRRRMLFQNAYQRDDGLSDGSLDHLLELTHQGGEVHFQVLHPKTLGAELSGTYDSSVHSVTTGPDALISGVWNHLVCVYSAWGYGLGVYAPPVIENLKLYVNGVLYEDRVFSEMTIPYHLNYVPSIGYTQSLPSHESWSGNTRTFIWADEGFQGLIDDVRFYERVLDDDEVSDLFEYASPDIW